MATAKNNLQETFGEAANAAKKSAADAARYVSDQSQQFVNSASSGISSASSYLGDRAEDATQGAASGLKSAGEAVQRWAPQAGTYANQARDIGERISSSGDYLKQSGVKGIEGDLIELVKQFPLPAFIVGIGLGYFLANLSRPRR